MGNKQLSIFDGSVLKDEQAQKKTWFRKFKAYCENIYETEGSINGRFCCGYDWMCDECYCRILNGCSDCVKTIKTCLQECGATIDYTDYDFKKWEKLAHDLYAKKKGWKV